MSATTDVRNFLQQAVIVQPPVTTETVTLDVNAKGIDAKIVAEPMRQG